MGRPSFSPSPKKQRLYVYSWQGKVGCVFPRQFAICTTVFLHPITFWTRLILNLVRAGKKWDGPVFPHPKTNDSFSSALALNITDVERFEVGKKLTGWGKNWPDGEKLTGYFFLPRKRMNSQFLPGEEMGRPDSSPGKDWRGEKTDCYTGVKIFTNRPVTKSNVWL